MIDTGSAPAQVLTRLHAELDSLSTQSWAGLAPAEQVAASTSLAKLKARLTAHEFACAQAMQDSKAARAAGSTSTGALLAGQFGGDRRGADAAVRRAEQIGKATATQDALAAGRVSEKQAALIAGVLGKVPEQHRDAAEAKLLDEAPRTDYKTLERRADRISDTWAEPEVVDATEDEILAAREKRAWRKTEFWMGAANDGVVKGGFTIPEAQADMLRTAVEALAAPQHQNPADATLDERPTPGQIRGRAFCALIESIDTTKLPTTNAVGPILTINLDYDVLLGKLKAATLSTGTRISAGEARRMACEHRLLPTVFDGKSLPLDQGRDKRLFTTAQRRALEHRDKGCSFPGCDRPPGWCVAHHANEQWAHGGDTDLKDGVLICPAHHRILHTDNWHIQFVNGIPEYIPPASVDPHRRPRRHTRYNQAA